MEMVTASKMDINLVPVFLYRHGEPFQYPGEDFFVSVRGGKYFDLAAADLLGNHQITNADVEGAIRKVFSRIAVRYSPHSTRKIRDVEL